MSVAIDSMVIIWGMQSARPATRKPTTQNVPELQRRAAVLLDELAETGETVIVPSIVAAETLIKIDPDKHGEFIAQLHSLFVLPPFNLAAASLAARLWQRRAEKPSEKANSRVCLKADLMIIATAVVTGASVYYSHEPKFRKMAEETGIQARDLPMCSSNLFRDAEIRRQIEGDTEEANT